MKSYDPFDWARRLMDFRSQPAGEEQQKQMEQELGAIPGMHGVLDELSDVDAISGQLQVMSSFDVEKALKKVRRPLLVRRILWWSGSAAAAVLISAFLLLNQLSDGPERMALKPGVETPDGVTLKLADGAVIGVDTMDAYTSGTGVKVRNAGGLLSFFSNEAAVAEKALNRLNVPVHTTYAMVLPDGSRVWLNAGSSLEFPTAFSGENRTVRLQGEAYFEVTHDAAKPFIVQNSGPDVVVLGTRFNLRSYPDEAFVAATLESGSIALRKASNELARVKPGEQVLYDQSSQSASIHTVDTERFSAWKSGLFWFEDAPLKEIMARVGRWYGMDVVFDQASLKNIQYSGKMKMYEDVDDVLSKFSKSGDLQFRQEGGCIHVRKPSASK